MSDTAPQTILVTGGSGYIAGYVIAALIARGFSVRTTVRSLSREAEVRATLKKITDPSGIQFIAADLNVASLDEARRNLADLPHLTVRADIGDPSKFIAELAANGLTPDVIDTWIWYKQTHEVEALRTRPHPYEFVLYYDV